MKRILLMTAMLMLCVNLVAGNEKSNRLVREGEKLFKEEKYDKALNLFIRAKDTDPKDAAAWNNAGLVYLLKEKNQESLLFFKRAIALSQHCNIYTNLGVAYFKSGEREKGTETFQNGFKLCPEDERMKQWFGYVTLMPIEKEEADKN